MEISVKSMNFILFLKGLFIGSTMTIPGVSGGTMAIIIGVYEDLIHSVNNLKKEPAKNISFLFNIALGGLTGFILFARGITYLLSNPVTNVYVRLIFAIIVICGIPLLVKKSNIQKISVGNIISLLAGAFLVLSLATLPDNLFSPESGLLYIIIQFCGGLLVAIALVLPGISTSHMLYILGLYTVVLENVYSFKWLNLIPIICGVIIGTFITANILENFLNKYTTNTYMVIIGFVAGSVVSLMIG